MKGSLVLSCAFHFFILSLLFLSTVFTKTMPPVKAYYVRIIVPPVPEPIGEKIEPIEPKKLEPERIEQKSTVRVEPQKKKLDKKESQKKKTGMGSKLPIRLDVPDFNSPFYVSLIYTKVFNNWLNPNPQVRAHLVAVVYFRIRRDGKIAELKLDRRSGSTLFDEAAVNAIRLSEPFPPLPDEFQRDFLGVYFEFEHVPE